MDGKPVNPQPTPMRSPVVRVSGSRFIHQVELGRIQCPVCGRCAYSRNPVAIRIWEAAHEKYCRKPALPVPIKAACA